MGALGHPSQEPSVLSPAEVGDIRVSVLGHCAPCHPTSTRNKCTFERADARQPSLSGAQRRAPAPVQALGDGCDAGTSPTDLSGTLQSLISCFPNGLGEKVCPCALYNTCGASNHSKEAGEVWHRSPRCRSISWVLPYPWLWLSPPCHDPAGSATTRSPASPLLRGGATRSSLPHHPPSSSPSTAEAHPSTVPASGTPVPTQPLFSIPPAALRISDTPRRPGRGDRAVQHGSCVPLPGDGIHQPPAHSPSPDLGMAIPRLGPSPGNAACQQAEPGGRVEGSREG